MANKVSIFISEVKTELKKVTWPTRVELIGSTKVVLITVVFLALYIGVVDFIMSKLIRFIIR